MIRVTALLVAAIILSGCAQNHYSSRSISSSINHSVDMNSSGKGVIVSPHGNHDINVKNINYKVSEISHRHDRLEIVAEGLVEVHGSPYKSSPSFNAEIYGRTSWSEHNSLVLHIDKASKITLSGISRLHLNGIRNEVKDIIAMTLIENSNVHLKEIKFKEGNDVRIWNL